MLQHFHISFLPSKDWGTCLKAVTLSAVTVPKQILFDGEKEETDPKLCPHAQKKPPFLFRSSAGISDSIASHLPLQSLQWLVTHLENIRPNWTWHSYQCNSTCLTASFLRVPPGTQKCLWGKSRHFFPTLFRVIIACFKRKHAFTFSLEMMQFSVSYSDFISLFCVRISLKYSLNEEIKSYILSSYKLRPFHVFSICLLSS